MPHFVLDLDELDHYSAVYSWERVDGPEPSRDNGYMVSYTRNRCRLNFWLRTGSVGSYLHHPKKKQKRTQLFRRDISMAEAESIFIDPRTHTGKGYHEKKELEGRKNQGNSILAEPEAEPDIAVVGGKRSRGEAMDTEDEEEEQARPTKKSKVSCRFGAYCTREDCTFEHRCRYGSSCNRSDCRYDHTDVDSQWWYNQECRYGSNCGRGDCLFQHSLGKSTVMCNYGLFCTRRGCWYEHPAHPPE